MVFVDVFCVVVLSLLCFLVFFWGAFFGHWCFIVVLGLGLSVQFSASTVQYVSACESVQFSDKSIHFSTMQYPAVQLRRRQDV